MAEVAPPAEPLYVGAECMYCGHTIIRYRWEDAKKFIHANTGRRECLLRTVATPAPEKTNA